MFLTFLSTLLLLSINLFSNNLDFINYRESESISGDLQNMEYSFEENNILYFDFIEHPLVKKFIVQYQSNFGKENLKRDLKKSIHYIEYISKIIDKKNVPLEITYLPLIESNFSPKAVSKSGAKGLWQFMMNSISGFGLSVTEWHDERSDIIKSTDAAINKLLYNYKETDDWLLAIAAYNCGLGKVTRTVKATGINDFWELARKRALPNETIQYVPKLLAAAYVCSNKTKNNLPLWQEYAQWETIKLEKPVDIRTLSKKIDIPLYQLKLGNPELKYNITPPSKNYELKVPKHKKEVAESVINDPDIQLMNFYIYKIKQGDTLYALCAHYGVSLNLIKQFNPNIRPNSLKIGVNLIIPAIRDVKQYTPTKLTKVSNQNAKNNFNIKEYNGPPFNKKHLITKGETLWNLSKKYDTTIEAICYFNNLNQNDLLKINSTIKVPGE